MKKSHYKFVFSIFNILAVAIMVVFSGFVLIQLKSILFKSSDKNDDFLPVHNFEKGDGKQAKLINQAETKKGDIKLGEKDDSKIKSAFQWPDDEGLIDDAVQLFQQKKNWEACVYLQSIQIPDKQNKPLINSFINNFYQAMMAKAMQSELVKIPYFPEGNKLDIKQLFKDLQFDKSLVLLNNLYVFLVKESVPAEISEIMVRFTLSQLNDPFLKMVSNDMLDSKPQKYRDYSDASDFADSCLKTKEKVYLELYMWQCLAELWRSWTQSGRDTNKWILDYKTNVDERAYLEKLIKERPLLLKQKAYLRLSQFHRALLAKYAFSNINNQKQEDFFNNYIYWAEDVVGDKDYYKNLASILRQTPNWNSLINKQKYDLAVTALINDYYVMTLTKMPDNLKKRISEMAAVEKKLWFENVNDEIWKSMVIAKTNDGKRAFTSKVFWQALYAIFPQTNRTNDQKMLLAACLTNRGFNPKVFVNLGIDNNLLKKFIPPEELNAK